jgi:hypothetical protein
MKPRVSPAELLRLVKPAGKGDLGAGWQHHLGVGTALGGDEVAAVGHGGRQRTMVNHRPSAGTPGGACLRLVAVGGLVTEQLHAIAALDQQDAFGCELFEFNGLYLGAVLLALAAALRLLVAVEHALDAFDRAMEQVDGGPEQIVKVRLQPRVGDAGLRISSGMSNTWRCSSDSPKHTSVLGKSF